MNSFLKFTSILSLIFVLGICFSMKPAEAAAQCANKGSYYDGEDDYKFVPTSNIQDEFTFTVWVKTNEYHVNENTRQREIFFRKGSNMMLGYEYEMTEHKVWLRYYIRYADGSTQEVEWRDTYDQITRDNTWHNFVVSFKKGRFMKLYIDGKLVDKEVVPNKSIRVSSNSNDFVLGARIKNDGTIDRNLRGRILGFKSFDYVFSDTLVTSLYAKNKDKMYFCIK